MMEFWEAIDEVIENLSIDAVYGYPGFQSSKFFQLEASELMLNERTCVHSAHVASYLGERSMVFFKNAGFYSTYLQMLNSSILGVNSAMIAVVTDDIHAKGSESIKSSQETIESLQCISYRPSTPQEMLDKIPQAVKESEEYGLPAVILLENGFFGKLGEQVKLPEYGDIPGKDRVPDEWILHPETAGFFTERHEERYADYTGEEPDRIEFEDESYIDKTSKYSELYSKIKKAGFDIVTGGFGGYTKAEDSCIDYALSYNGAIASALGAQKTGRKALAVTGDGGITHEPTALYEASRKEIPITVVIIDNDGISDKRPTEVNITELIPSYFEYRKIDSKEIEKESFEQPKTVYHIDY